MWITHPQTGRSTRTDKDIKARCEDCLRNNPNTSPISEIRLVNVGNRYKLVCVKYHLRYYERTGE